MLPENCKFCRSQFSAKIKKALVSFPIITGVFGHYFFKSLTERFFSEKEKPSPVGEGF